MRDRAARQGILHTRPRRRAGHEALQEFRLVVRHAPEHDHLALADLVLRERHAAGREPRQHFAVGGLVIAVVPEVIRLRDPPERPGPEALAHVDGRAL